mgnify:CR=1 FL=1
MIRDLDASSQAVGHPGEGIPVYSDSGRLMLRDDFYVSSSQKEVVWIPMRPVEPYGICRDAFSSLDRRLWEELKAWEQASLESWSRDDGEG